MEQFEIGASIRSSSGTKNARALRKQGSIPAVVYSKGQEAQSILIETREFVQAAEKALPSQTFKFKSEDSSLQGTEVLVKDVQLDGETNAVLHVDFHRLHKGESVDVRIPLDIEGEAPGVKNQGGVLAKLAREILISCQPDAIPATITINVSNLALGQRIQSGDIELPAGAKLAGSPDVTIVNVIAGREARLADSGAVDAAAEGEGEEAAASEESEGEEAK